MPADRIARANALVQALAQRVAFVGVLGMLAVGVLATVDVVVLRSLFSAPIPGSNEFLNTIFAVAIAAVLPSGLAQRTALEVDVLKDKLGPYGSAWLRAAGAALFTVILVVLAWRVAVHSFDAQRRGLQTIILQWPMWPFLWIITGLIIACIPVQIVVFVASVAEIFNAPRPVRATAGAGSAVRSGSDRTIVWAASALLFGALALSAAI